MQKLSIVMLLIISLALGSPGISSAARIFATPTADLLGPGVGELVYNYLPLEHSLALDMGLHPQLNVGVRQSIGADFAGTIKLGILREGAGKPGMAIGGDFGFGKSEFYVALSKQLGSPVFRGHLAFGNGRYSRALAGVTYVLNPVQVVTKQSWTLPTMSLGLEYDGGGLGAGLIAKFSPEFQGYVATNFQRGIGLGVSYKTEF